MSGWMIVLGCAYLAGIMTAEVMCMLLERQFYAGAVFAGCAVILLITARRLA